MSRRLLISIERDSGSTWSKEFTAMVYSRLGCGLNTHGAMTSVVEAQDSDGGMNDVDHSMHFTLPTYRATPQYTGPGVNVKKEREQNNFRVKSIS